MKMALAAMLIAGGVVSAAKAEPRESITFTNVNQDGMRNWYQNEFRDCAFTGDYMASKVRISGVIRSLVPSQTLLETQIAIGAPDWNIIWVYPFGDLSDEYTTWTLADSEFDLESPVRASGEWAFQFFETADDPEGPDAVWESVTLTLDDAPPPMDIWYEYLKVDSGETLGTGQTTRGYGPLREIRGFGSAADADLYKVHISDPAHFTAFAQLLRYFGDGAQLCLFNPDGTGVVAIDALTPVLPIIDSSLINLDAGDYILGISTSHRYPVDAAGNRLWNDTVNVQSVPNGPGAANPVHHWEGTGDTIQYHLTLTGVVYASVPNTCNVDFNHDGDFGTDADIEAFFQCLANNCCRDCTADFNDDGDTGTDADIEAFFRVLAGGHC